MFGKLTVRYKLLAGFLGTAALAGILGVISSQRIGALIGHLDEIVALHEDSKEMARFESLLLEEARAEQKYLLTRDTGALEAQRKLQRDFESAVKSNQELAIRAGEKAEAEGLESILRMHREYVGISEEVASRVTSRGFDEAIRHSVAESEKQVGRILPELRRVVAEQAAEASRDIADARSLAAWTKGLVLALGGVAVLVALALGIFIARSITRPLATMVAAAGRLAEGKLDQKVDYRSGDELGSLAEAFRGMIVGFSAPVNEAAEVLERVAARDLTARMRGEYSGDFSAIKTSINRAVEQLDQAMTDVKASADQVATTAQQLSSASEEISSGAQEQAASLEETSSTMEEMSAAVKQNAENALQANQLSAGSRDSAANGGQAVSAAIAGMAEINGSSKRIADIITTIDEIAFQTNLLALNAAVEAARAGEQGRGFAVVASEVRNLAQRSATAAKEIKGLIQDSVRKVEAGSELVNRSGQVLGDIVDSVKRVTDIVSEIAAASQEQSSGIQQMATAMSQMDQVTQSNASQTEELSSSAEELTATAEQLQALVGQFSISGDAVPVRASVAAAPPAKGKNRPAGVRGARPPARPGQSKSKSFDEF